MKSKHNIGSGFDAEFVERWNQETDKLHQAWCPMIEVNGRKVFIQDKTTYTGCVECHTRIEALNYAADYTVELKGIA